MTHDVARRMHDDADASHHEPQSFITQVRLEPGPQGHRGPVRAASRSSVGLVGARAVQPDAAADRLPGRVRVHRPERYYQFVTMHGMIMVIYLLTALFLGGFGNYLIPLMVRRARHGVPVHEHAELLGLPAVGDHPDGQLLRAGRAHRRGLDALSAAGHPARHAGHRLGHRPDAGVAGGLHRRDHDGRPELRDHRAAGALPRHDAAAHAAVGVGHLHGHRSWRCWPSRRCS